MNPKLTVANRTMSRFNDWNLDINAISLEDESYLDAFDIIINTTPAGMVENKESV